MRVSGVISFADACTADTRNLLNQEMADEGDDTQVHQAAQRQCIPVCVLCMPSATSLAVLL